MTTSAQPEPRTTGCPVARAYPFSPAQALDIDPTYAMLQADEPLARIKMPHGEEGWLATRYEDVRTVLGDRRFSRAAVVGRDVPRMRPEIDRQTTSILNMDPPEHTRLRKLVAKAFTARRVEAMRPRAQSIMDGLVDAMIATGPPADLVEAVATPLPVTIICELLGVPVADRDIFRAGSDAALSTSALNTEERVAARDAMIGYMAGLVARRRVEPTDDLIGALVEARDAGDKLSEPEMVQLAIGVLIAGHETTLNQIGNFTYLLLTHPDQAALLRRAPDDIAGAVEELLRYVPLGANAEFPRIASEDIELGGVLVRAGEPVVVAVHMANRDPSVFDAPDELRLDRDLNSHLGFGHGVHHCLGAQLARMELQVALGTLVRRLPGLALAVKPADVTWRSGALVRGPLALPVTWEAARG